MPRDVAVSNAALTRYLKEAHGGVRQSGRRSVHASRNLVLPRRGSESPVARKPIDTLAVSVCGCLGLTGTRHAATEIGWGVSTRDRGHRS